jgi:hypothetical protein
MPLFYLEILDRPHYTPATMSDQSPASSALLVIVAGVAFLALSVWGVSFFFKGVNNSVVGSEVVR